MLYPLRGGRAAAPGRSTFTPTRFATGFASPRWLALDDTYLYVSADDGIWRTRRCGPPPTLVTADTHGAVTGLAVHAGFVAWATTEGGLWHTTR